MKKTITLLLFIFILCSCNDDDYTAIGSNLDTDLKTMLIDISEGKGISYFILPESNDYQSIPQDPLNLITNEKVALGKLLLHETAFGNVPKIKEMKATYSCASCHHAAAGFSAGLRQGIGECGVGFGGNGNGRTANTNTPIDSMDIQPVRSPTILNVAYQDVMLWNGQFGGTGTNQGTESQWEEIQENFLGFQGIEVQAIKGQVAHRLSVDETLLNTNGYKEMFDKAFGDIEKSERYTAISAGLAMAAYERTLLANQSPWQDWLKGDYDAMTDTEKKGAVTFFGKGKCYECHSGPALNDKGFYAFGMGDFDNSQKALIIDDVKFQNFKKGRGGFTKKSSDDYKFKTPTLYNLIDNGFYGHGGTFTSVKAVIEYKKKGVSQSQEVPTENLAPQFGAIDLTDQEINDLTAFIEISLRDINLIRYSPIKLNSGNCFPNNDERSQEDLGCK